MEITKTTKRPTPRPLGSPIINISLSNYQYISPYPTQRNRVLYYEWKLISIISANVPRIYKQSKSSNADFSLVEDLNCKSQNYLRKTRHLQLMIVIMHANPPQLNLLLLIYTPPLPLTLMFIPLPQLPMMKK